MEFKTPTYEIEREGEDVTLSINYENVSFAPSIEDNKLCMADTVDKLIEVPDVTKIVFSQKREYEYDFAQTKMLLECARLYNNLVKQKNIFSLQALNFNGVSMKWANTWYNELQLIIFQLMKADPVGAYVEIHRTIRRETIAMEKSIDEVEVGVRKKYIALLSYIMNLLEKTRLIVLAKPYIAGYKIGDRDIYRKVFRPIIKPDFMFTKLMANYPDNGIEIDNYTIGDNTEITVFRFPDSVQFLYHVMPPEFKLSEEKYDVLDMARKIMAEHKPKKEEFVNPERMRQVFLNVGRDLIEELVNYRNITLPSKEIDELAHILVRYTVGFGLIEVLLQDEKIQDISINSPMGFMPMFIVHADYDDCKTNIIPTPNEAESWASKLRFISGRPLDEANPILDTELNLPGASTRVSVISQPLDPTGLAFSFRRHRDKPWTLALFVKYKTITPLAAGLISFLIDGTRTLLLAGTRSSGKTSLLSSFIVEIMRRYRIITIEDTLELPVDSLRHLGFNVQGMKVASALQTGSTEVNADIGIRSTLRLGDSSLIIGEVRSTEAKALYEAMRVGAAANVVAGTIHADSPYGVYDRVVNDIGVPKTSFKATDICIVVNPVKSADGLHKYRRVTQITEVRKTWTEDPLHEKGFLDLMKYDATKDQLNPTDDFITGESEILKAIAGNIKEFAGNWQAVWDNIQLRGQLKEALVKYSEQVQDPDLLEAPFVIKSNDQFHLISEKVKDEVGFMDPKRIYADWEAWMKREAKRYKKDAENT